MSYKNTNNIAAVNFPHTNKTEVTGYEILAARRKGQALNPGYVSFEFTNNLPASPIPDIASASWKHNHTAARR